MRSLIRRAENAVINVYEFWANVCYYLGKGHHPSQAISLARDTLPARRGDL